MYNFDENTPPKEIVLSACNDIAAALASEGYKFLKSRMDIEKKTDEFVFSIHFQSDRYNAKGEGTRCWVSCQIGSNLADECYYGHNLGTISLNNFMEWEFYGKSNYNQSVADILQRLNQYFIPLTKRFMFDMEALVPDVVARGFYPDNPQTGYDISACFLLRYGNKTLLQEAIQRYYDLCYIQAKKNFQKTVLALQNGNQPDALYAFQSLAEAVVQQGLSIAY